MIAPNLNISLKNLNMGNNTKKDLKGEERAFNNQANDLQEVKIMKMKSWSLIYGLCSNLNCGSAVTEINGKTPQSLITAGCNGGKKRYEKDRHYS